MRKETSASRSSLWKGRRASVRGVRIHAPVFASVRLEGRIASARCVFSWLRRISQREVCEFILSGESASEISEVSKDL